MEGKDIIKCVNINEVTLSGAQIIKSTVNVSKITYLSLPLVLTENVRETFPLA